MAKTCVNHKDQPSITMCHQCHKPLCKSCTLVTSYGSFCSSECAVLFREFKEKMKVSSTVRKSGMGMAMMMAFLIVIVLLVGVHVARRKGVRILEKVDLIGRLLNSAKSVNK